jgi:hypothetical protein
MLINYTVSASKPVAMPRQLAFIVCAPPAIYKTFLFPPAI